MYYPGRCLQSTSQSSRRKYVQDFLHNEAQDIQNKAAQGDPAKNIQGVNITLADAKRVPMKQLGMFRGNTVTGTTQFDIDDKQLDMVYNALAIKRSAGFLGQRK